MMVAGALAATGTASTANAAGIDGADALLSRESESAASAWVDGEFARSRLLASFESVAPDGSPIYLAWEVVLQDGWKTYWRSPGEAGKPPVFSWAGSTNLADAELQYPLPERFELFDIQTFGYGDRLILPIRIEPQLSGTRMVVQASVSYLVCKDICVPLDAHYELEIPVSTAADERGSFADEIFASLERVPRAPSGKASEPLLRSVALHGPAGNQRLTVEIEGGELLSAADVFVEAGTDVMFDAPRKALVGDGTRAQFTMNVGSYKRGLDIAGRELTLTISDGWGNAIEQLATLEK